MVSVEKWKEHFKRLTSRLHSPDDVYLVNQTGRGLGRNSYPKRVLYKVRRQTGVGVGGGGGSGGGGTKVEIVSPVAQNINQARALIKGSKNGIKKKHSGKGVTKKKKHERGNISKGKKKKSSKKKTPVKKKKKKKPIRKRNKKKREI